jgi:hypothetical protein
MVKKIFSTSALIDGKTKEAQERIQDFYNSHGSANQTFQSEANTDALLNAGDQEVLHNLGFNRVLPYMDMYTSNKVRRLTSLVSGIQRRNRKSTIVIPVEGSDQKTADQLSKIIYNMNTNGAVLETISDTFQMAVITGLTLLQMWNDYADDPESGSLKVDMCPYNSFFIDSTFRKPDLSDCSTIWKRSYLTPNACKALLPDQSDKIEYISNNSGPYDDVFPYLAPTFDAKDKYLSYDEYYYRDYRTADMLIDTVLNKKREYFGKEKDVLSYFLKQNRSIIHNKEKIPTVKLCILVNGIVMYDGENPLGIDEFPFVPFFGQQSPSMTDMYLRFQGLPRGMRDLQFLYNLMTSLEVEYVQSRVNPIVIYKPTSLVNPKLIENRDLSNGLALKKSGFPQDIQFINPMDIPTSIPLIREQSAKDLMENDGGNEELFGSTENDTMAGILSMLRQTSGQTIIKPLLDFLDRSQKQVGRLQIKTIQKNYLPEKVMRITNEEPTIEFYNRSFADYDAAIEEGVNTTTQKQNQFAQVMAMRQAGVQIPDELVIQLSTLQNKNEITEYMNNLAQEQAQTQQQETQITQELQQAEAALVQARAQADLSLAAERESKIGEQQTRALANLAEANKDDEQATLDKIKAIKELFSMDLAHLEKLITLANDFKATEQEQKMQPMNPKT